MDRLWRLVIITLVLAIVAGFVVLMAGPKEDIRIVITPGEGISEKKFGIYGAVKTPGIYSYKGEIRIEEAAEIAGGLEENADPSLSNLAKWINDGETIIIPTMGGIMPTLTPLIPDETKVNLNTADKAELMTLPGIGEKRAGDIIKLREQFGGFRSKEDILAISGISEKLLESIYDRIIVK